MCPEIIQIRNYGPVPKAEQTPLLDCGGGRSNGGRSVVPGAKSSALMKAGMYQKTNMVTKM